MDRHPLAPEAIWPALVQRTEAAIACGSLHTIATRQMRIGQGGVNFIVRTAANLKRKAEEKGSRQGQGPAFDPFLPPEPELTVGDISSDHVAVLNKFNVVDYHLLIVTRRFEHQETLLTASDFSALWSAMAGYEVLGFYNGGEVAGASQAHKHLQMIPLPMADEGPPLPMEALMGGEAVGTGKLPSLPFRHRWTALEPDLWRRPARAAAWTRERYLEMLSDLGIAPVERDGTLWQSAPYNLLVTRRWMMVVPRRREDYEGISINAMGFAGSLFVADEAQMRTVEQVGPMGILEAVA